MSPPKTPLSTTPSSTNMTPTSSNVSHTNSSSTSPNQPPPYNISFAKLPLSSLAQSATSTASNSHAGNSVSSSGITSLLQGLQKKGTTAINSNNSTTNNEKGTDVNVHPPMASMHSTELERPLTPIGSMILGVGSLMFETLKDTVSDKSLLSQGSFQT